MKRKCFLLLLALTVCAFAVISVSAHAPRLVDDGQLLSSYEEAALTEQLDRVSQAHQLDVVIVTADTLNGKSPRAYADDYFDYNGYGLGQDRDGILLLVSMEDRDWYISTSGYGIRAFTDAGIEYIGDRIVPDLSDGEYADAFEDFIELCDEFITRAKTEGPYDIHNLPKEPFNVGTSLLVALVVGAVITLIVMLILKGQLKSVKAQSAAADYIKQNSMRLTDSSEFFLYHTVSKVAKPKDNGGSGTHRASSGRSHGGGGGKF